jgi:hypothetical protein
MTESEHARLAAARVPRRLARLRLEVLDRLLGDLTHMRHDGFRTLPPVVADVIADLARAHDVSLPGIGDAASREITIAERYLLAARSQVMQELQSLGGGASWDDLEFA